MRCCLSLALLNILFHFTDWVQEQIYSFWLDVVRRFIKTRKLLKSWGLVLRILLLLFHVVSRNRKLACCSFIQSFEIRSHCGILPHCSHSSVLTNKWSIIWKNLTLISNKKLILMWNHRSLCHLRSIKMLLSIVHIWYRCFSDLDALDLLLLATNNKASIFLIRS